MSLKNKAIALFLILLAIFAAHSFYANYYLHRLVEETKISNSAHQMVEEILQARRYEKNFILRGQDEWAELWKMHLANLFSKFADYKKITRGREDAKNMEKLFIELDSYRKAVDDYIAFYKDKQLRPEPEVFILKGRTILGLCEEARDRAEVLIKEYLDNIIKSRILVLLIFVAFSLVVFYLTHRAVINPIIELQHLCRQIEKNGSFNPDQVKSIDALTSRFSLRNDEIGELALSYKDMISRCGNSYVSLQEKMKEIEDLYKMKSDFTSVVSHELRTPLTAIKEGIDLVLDGSAGGVNAEQKEFLDIAKRNVDRLARLINEVLDFSKLTSKKFEFKVELVDLNDVIKSALNNYRLEAEKKDLYLKTRLEVTEGLFVKIDPDNIMRILTNLINNAVKFTGKGGITLFTDKSEKDNFIKVCVEDTGIGIRREDIPKLFQPFVQVGLRSERKTGGAGLGLAICKQIIEQLGGRIWVESEFGKGSRFYLLFPLEERRKA